MEKGKKGGGKWVRKKRKKNLKIETKREERKDKNKGRRER
jgi:hypothetical protein